MQQRLSKCDYRQILAAGGPTKRISYIPSYQTYRSPWAPPKLYQYLRASIDFSACALAVVFALIYKPRRSAGRAFVLATTLKEKCHQVSPGRPWPVFALYHKLWFTIYYYSFTVCYYRITVYAAMLGS